ncbi:MAG: hypothetical protein ACM3TN_20190 [Alphaproteobacteria bacterium]
MKTLARFLPSFSSVFFLLIFIILLLKSGSILLADGDTGYHIRTGEFIIRNWTIPTHDIFSYLKPAPKWIAHEWLSEVLMAMIYHATGLSGIVIFFAAFLALTHAFLYQCLRRRSGDVLAVILITAIAVATSATHWLARPHVFSLALTLAWYHALNSYQFNHRNTLKYLPALMLLWVNLHGGFVLGLILLVIFTLGNCFGAIAAPPSIAEERWRKAKQLALFAILCAGVACINPRGYEILLFPFKLTSDQLLMDRVTEFLSPNFHKPLPFKYMLLIFITAVAFSRIRLDPIEVGLVVLLTYMSLYSVRYVSLYAIIVAPPLLRLIEDLFSQLPPRFWQFYRRRTQNLAVLEPSTSHYLWPAISVSLTTALAITGLIHFEFSTTRFPVAAVEFLKHAAIPGNIFNDDEFGDYMIFAAWPQYRVFIDGRSDMYGPDRITDYLKVADGQPDWENTIQKYDISLVFFAPQSPIAAILRGRKDWSVIYSDEIASIFLRNDVRHQPLIDKYRNTASIKYH